MRIFINVVWFNSLNNPKYIIAVPPAAKTVKDVLAHIRHMLNVSKKNHLLLKYQQFTIPELESIAILEDNAKYDVLVLSLDSAVQSKIQQQVTKQKLSKPAVDGKKKVANKKAESSSSSSSSEESSQQSSEESSDSIEEKKSVSSSSSGPDPLKDSQSGSIDSNGREILPEMPQTTKNKPSISKSVQINNKPQTIPMNRIVPKNLNDNLQRTNKSASSTVNRKDIHGHYLQEHFTKPKIMTPVEQAILPPLPKRPEVKPLQIVSPLPRNSHNNNKNNIQAKETPKSNSNSVVAPNQPKKYIIEDEDSPDAPPIEVKIPKSVSPLPTTVTVIQKPQVKSNLPTYVPPSVRKNQLKQEKQIQKNQEREQQQQNQKQRQTNEDTSAAQSTTTQIQNGPRDTTSQQSSASKYIEVPVKTLESFRKNHNNESFLKAEQNIEFKITELDEVRFVPIASEWKGGRITKVVGEDITIAMNNEEEMNLYESMFLALRLCLPVTLDDERTNVLKELSVPSTQISKNSAPAGIPSVVADNTHNTSANTTNNSKANNNPGQTDLKTTVANQVNYYFSDKNYNKDNYLLMHASQHPGHYVKTSVIMNCPKIKRMLKEEQELIEIMKETPTSSTNYELHPTDPSLLRKKGLRL